MKTVKNVILIGTFLLVSQEHFVNGQSLCPGALNCQNAQVFCSWAEIDDLKCQLSQDTNDVFPKDGLCLGVGVPNNLQWWTFIGSGSPFTMTFNIDTIICDLGFGIQAGIFTGDCSGTEVLDCNANCNTNSFTLSGNTNCGEIYHLWVDGCLGFPCPFSIDMTPATQAPQLPDTIQRPLVKYHSMDCSKLTVSITPFQDHCQVRQTWTIDGKPYDEQGIYGAEEYVLDLSGYDVTDSVELCLTLTVGGPDTAKICDQLTECWVLNIQVKHITTIDTFICSNDELTIQGIPYSGIVCDTIIKQEGSQSCDSVFNVTIRRPNFSVNWSLDTQSMVLCHGLKRLPACGVTDTTPFRVIWRVDGRFLGELPGEACAHISDEGKYEIDILYETENGSCKTGITFSQEVRFDITTSSDNTHDLPLSIYPNPSYDHIQIQSGFDFSIWKILDINGQVFLTGSTKRSVIDVSSLTSGIYFLVLQDNKGNMQTERICKY
ncbi:MAG: T9SS type A sorting domain-containing protein [Saprospiraceae bacterium]|nr:T9SS type A sorting domain-containing protein [Saprospiraceae bacterium]